MPKLCICRICTCGRHKCPHNPNGIPKFNGPCTFSEYANQYQPHPLEIRKSFKPDENPVMSNGPMDDKTTHRIDYVPHPLAERERMMPRQEQFTQPEGEMDLLTNYLKEFTEKPLEFSRPIRPTEQRRAPGKFEGEPTYAADYKEWEVKPRERAKNDQGPYQPPEIPFDASTNYQSEFLPKIGEPARTMKPAEQPKYSNDPFDGDTHYRQDYIKHPLAAKEVKEKPVWVPNTTPMDDLSHYKKDFVPKSVDRSVAFKPDATAYSSQAPFVGDTTQKVDYVPWPAERRLQREKDEYKKPEGELDLNTTTKIDYVPKPFEKQAICRPMEVKRAPGKFDDTTNYKSEYRKWTPTGDKHQRVKEEYIPSQAPFEGLPTYQADYINYPSAQPARSIRPSAEQSVQQGPLDDMTEYKKEFYRKQAAPCPVVLIETGADTRYQFSNYDEEGHRWFEVPRSTLVGGRH